MDKWNLLVDVALCENCHNCTLAAKDEHVGNDFPGYAAPQPARGHSWIRIERVVRGAAPYVDAAYRPTMCNHCDDAPCVRAGGGAVRKREDGIVIIDPVAARGRRDLVDACPYGAISWNEDLALPQTWIFDAHLLDAGWNAPRAVQVCPTGALRAVKQSDAAMQDQARRENLRVLKPELNTRPRVYYRNLHRFDRHFIAGGAIAEINGTLDCVAGASVVLLRGDDELARATTDGFGDFKFDGLEPGTYRVEVSHQRLGRASVLCQLVASMAIGEIHLSGSETETQDGRIAAAPVAAPHI